MRSDLFSDKIWKTDVVGLTLKKGKWLGLLKIGSSLIASSSARSSSMRSCVKA